MNYLHPSTGLLDLFQQTLNMYPGGFPAAFQSLSGFFSSSDYPYRKDDDYFFPVSIPTGLLFLFRPFGSIASWSCIECFNPERASFPLLTWMDFPKRTEIELFQSLPGFFSSSDLDKNKGWRKQPAFQSLPGFFSSSDSPFKPRPMVAPGRFNPYRASFPLRTTPYPLPRLVVFPFQSLPGFFSSSDLARGRREDVN